MIRNVTRDEIVEEKEARPRYLAVQGYANKDDLTIMTASPEFQAAREEMGNTMKGMKFDIKGALSGEPMKTRES